MSKKLEKYNLYFTEIFFKEFKLYDHKIHINLAF